MEGFWWWWKTGEIEVRVAEGRGEAVADKQGMRGLIKPRV